MIASGGPIGYKSSVCLTTGTRRQAPDERCRATDRSLIEKLKNPADQKSWSEFYATYRMVIRGTALRFRLTPEEADDVVQETTLAVVKAITHYDYDREIPFKRWLACITRRKIYDQFRQRRRELLADDHGIAEPLGEPVFDAVWRMEWICQLRDAALAKLEQHVARRDYRIFLLNFIEEQPAAEVAQSFGLKTSQVHKIKCLLLQHFREAALKIVRDSGPNGFDRIRSRPTSGSRQRTRPLRSAPY